jgi:hypothetical protein
MFKKIWIRKFLLIILVVAIAASLREYAAQNLYIDYDEPTYLNAALIYTNGLRSFNFKILVTNVANYEHPAFYKIVYGLVLLTRSPIATLSRHDFDSGGDFNALDGRPWGIAARNTSVFFGVASVLALAILNPLAGLALALDSLAVKYTSSIYLEALPALTSLLSVLAYLYWFEKEKRRPSKWNLTWLGLSAVLFGMSVASKYTFAVVGLAIAIHFSVMIVLKKIRLSYLPILLAWAVFSFLAFFDFDPYIWYHFPTQLIKSLNYHIDYTQSEDVLRYDYPFWQTLVWFTAPFSHFFKAAIPAMPVGLDTFLLPLAIIGLPNLFKKHLLFFIWLVVGVLALLVWPTKWPQYTMIMITPYCLSAGEGLTWLYMAGKKLLIPGNNFISRFTKRSYR